MRNHRRISIAPRQIDRVQSFTYGANLIHLDQNRVRNALLNATSEPLRIGDKQIVADKLYLVAELVGENAPALPVVFAEAAFNRNNPILAAPHPPQPPTP